MGIVPSSHSCREWASHLEKRIDHSSQAGPARRNNSGSVTQMLDTLGVPTEGLGSYTPSWEGSVCLNTHPIHLGIFNLGSRKNIRNIWRDLTQNHLVKGPMGVRMNWTKKLPGFHSGFLVAGHNRKSLLPGPGRARDSIKCRKLGKPAEWKRDTEARAGAREVHATQA